MTQTSRRLSETELKSDEVFSDEPTIRKTELISDEVLGDESTACNTELISDEVLSEESIVCETELISNEVFSEVSTVCTSEVNATSDVEVVAPSVPASDSVNVSPTCASPIRKDSVSSEESIDHQVISS